MRCVCVLLAWFAAVVAMGQAWSVSGSMGASYQVGDGAFRPDVTVGVHRDADYRFSLSMYATVTASSSADAVGRSPIVAVVPALTTHLWDGRMWSLSADAGIGIGHTFSREATDHNYHVYLIALPLEWFFRPDASVFVYPAIVGRSWQGHIGFTKDYMRIAVYVGYRLSI